MTRGVAHVQTPRNGIQYVVYPETREELKPIVFFDAGSFTRSDDAMTIGFHPHSGIGIVTYFHGTDLYHKDSGNNDGLILDGGAQWIRAGGGVWHEESYRRKEGAFGSWTGMIHQLWIQLPPEFEESEVDYANLTKEEIPAKDHVKVLVGEYEGVKGKMDVPLNMTYLDVHLKDSESWKWSTPKGQTTGFVFLRNGALEIDGQNYQGETMLILDRNEGEILVKSISETADFVVVLAEPSQFEIVGQGSQIHTNHESLKRSGVRIRELGKEIT